MAGRAKIISSNANQPLGNRGDFQPGDGKFSAARAKHWLWVEAGPKIDEKGFSVRLNTCKPCDRLVVRGKNWFCGSCGCGERKAAELHTKLRWERADCPLKKFK